MTMKQSHQVLALATLLALASTLAFADAAKPSSSKVDLVSFRARLLKQHNVHRAKHHVAPLVLSDKLNDVAQQYAEKLAATEQLQHSGGPYGENLFKSWSSDKSFPSPERVVDSLYGEIKSYDFSKATFSAETGHFTQLVWKGSKQLGCGVAQSATASVYVVCNYDPPGNIMGQFKENVLKP